MEKFVIIDGNNILFRSYHSANIATMEINSKIRASEKIKEAVATQLVGQPLHYL